MPKSLAAVIRSASSQRWNNAWPMCSPLAETADPVRTPRRNRIRQLGSEGAKRLRLAQQLRQLGDVRRDPPRFFFREQLGGRAWLQSNTGRIFA
jgi:hypothetical protein